MDQPRYEIETTILVLGVVYAAALMGLVAWII